MGPIASYRAAYLEAEERELRKVERKALKRTKKTAQYVTMKVNGTKRMQKFADRGWEVCIAVPLSSGEFNITKYLLRRPRHMVELTVGELLKDTKKLKKVNAQAAVFFGNDPRFTPRG